MGRNILIVVPHPDDETFGKAGTLAAHVEQGDNVTLVCTTMGQMGRRMGKPFFANRETLPVIREQELMKACEEIGIQDVRKWKMQDKTLQFRNPYDLADRIDAVIKELNPAIIYSFYPGHGVHPDHDALSAAVEIALRQMAKEKRPVFYGSAITANRLQALGKPDLIVDVTDVLDRKMGALQAHRSQSEYILKDLEDQLHKYPERRKEIMAAYTTENFWEYDFRENA